MPCTTILVGKNASSDGSTMIARNDDGLFETKKLCIMDPKKQKRKYKSVIGHCTVELPDNPLRYSYIPNVDTHNGVWPAQGINELNVGMTATETITSNPRVHAADPLAEYKKKEGKNPEVIGGLGEEDLVILVLPYIKSAREGVLRLGSLLEKYGTYERNGIAFNDENECWWLETIGGHHWIAVKVKDDEVVLMANQFGLDHFDFEDAFGAQKENLCSEDLREFIKNNHLDLNQGKVFNPRVAFGSRADSDHIYNTPRVWYLLRYFAPKLFENYKDDPENDNLPWSVIPEKKVTIQDIKYILSSYYQGTPYNPYNKDDTGVRGKYRSIGVPNSDDQSILQIRGYLPHEIKSLQWISFGGSAFTGMIPLYTNVNSFPKFISDNASNNVDTNCFYWSSRLIACLTDAHYPYAILFDERYQNTVFNEGHKLVHDYDEMFIKSKDLKIIDEANTKIVDMLKKESTDALGKILKAGSEHMKTRYFRGDN